MKITEQELIMYKKLTSLLNQYEIRYSVDFHYSFNNTLIFNSFLYDILTGTCRTSNEFTKLFSDIIKSYNKTYIFINYPNIFTYKIKFFNIKGSL